MRKLLGLLLALAFASLASAQPYNLSIKSFGRSGYLTWSNSACSPQLIHEALRASTPTGTWQHVAFVTNSTSLQLTNLPAAGSNFAAFFKLAWVGEIPMTFNYSYDEGFGFPAVTGQIHLGVMGPDTTWTWGFVDVGMLYDLHPVGTGHVTSVQWLSQTHLIVRLTYGSEGVYLDGTVQYSSSNGQCSMTGYSGSVYQSGFAGSDWIGTFTATRAP